MDKHTLASAGIGLALFFSHCPTDVHACVQVYGTTLDGMPRKASGVNWVLVSMKQTPEAKLERLRRTHFPASDEASKKELAAVEKILSGKPQDAISLLQAIENESPGRYSTAANLGTAYELAGDNQNALKWIKEGIARNHESHYGTEWLHLLILETKIRLASDPEYLKTHRIIPLPENFDQSSKIEISGQEYNIEQIKEALAYQLGERVVFVKPPDPVVADLLFSYARIEAHANIVEQGIKLLDEAQKYGFADSTLLTQTRLKYEWSAGLGWALKLALVGAIIVFIPTGLYVCYRKKWFFLTHSAYLKHKAEKEAARREKRAAKSPPELEHSRK